MPSVIVFPNSASERLVLTFFSAPSKNLVLPQWQSQKIEGTSQVAAGSDVQLHLHDCDCLHQDKCVTLEDPATLFPKGHSTIFLSTNNW